VATGAADLGRYANTNSMLPTGFSEDTRITRSAGVMRLQMHALEEHECSHADCNHDDRE
jgi:hypothetical protein